MALVYHKELDEDNSFSIWKIEEDKETLLNQLQLNGEEREKLESLRKGKRTLHWLTTRVLLRHMLKTDEFIECPSDANGKPYLVDFPYSISLTHSYDYAAVMLSKTSSCGIDIEKIKDTVLRIKHKFLRPEELSFIESDVFEKEKLYACWCAKEAVYKLQGKKGVSFYRDMTISPFTYTRQGTLALELNHPEKGKVVYTVYYEKFNEYMLAYVHENLA